MTDTTAAQPLDLDKTLDKMEVIAQVIDSERLPNTANALRALIAQARTARLDTTASASIDTSDFARVLGALLSADRTRVKEGASADPAWMEAKAALVAYIDSRPAHPVQVGEAVDAQPLPAGEWVAPPVHRWDAANLRKACDDAATVLRAADHPLLANRLVSNVEAILGNGSVAPVAAQQEMVPVQALRDFGAKWLNVDPQALAALHAVIDMQSVAAQQAAAKAPAAQAVTARDMEIAQAVRRACVECYSPDDTATDYTEKMGDLNLSDIIRAASPASTPATAVAATTSEDARPIPADVWYCAEHDNFYSADQKGMGQGFYERWEQQRARFPQSEAAMRATQQEGVAPVVTCCENCHALEATIDNLESMRPHWAQGHTDDSVAAQHATAALSTLWGLLGADNQTEAVQKLTALMEKRDRAALQSRIRRVLQHHGLTEHGDGVVEADIVSVLLS